ncbi:hypothetical protein N7499_006474 [Penicillium canescens]|uniref:SnoaL-like domain-containing protein n=1 Tax=Penicillium canescens TaxID=5083 RepID=A0AAD6IEH3_PENCN|nr:uncharacterized protein N7446_002164 [Penicillium canescens]KAJ5997219.1 hypothetical protein N7522_008879 [Penicillium canescens]KAJ6043967.1 hypothetical protein N7460_005322 [Penicillium canescens]KAJ6055440.1 hypothetical protein N7444_004538 [Penicillium canescens]KAJ6074387.1 hypothetical protein N7446_002164 [Penicillium canescens]KAJ6081600.1 hypothetical protein N7499_006474 [Penicillium canescens]
MSAGPELDNGAVLKWLEAFHRASATLNTDRWLDEFMTDDVEMQYANSPVIKGNEVRQMFKTVLGQLGMMTHEIRYFDYVAPRIYQAATIRYLVKGDSLDTDEITIPGFAVFFVRKDDAGRVKCYRAETFLDPSAVFQRIAEKSSQL